MTPPKPLVAVIGGGPLGLMATKVLLEDGFNVTCFEARPYVGGLWNFSDDSVLSVAEGTVFNSSRYRSAISDYPFPDDTDDFPTWRQMWQYLEGYADHFNLRPHIRLNSRVTGLSRAGSEWVVDVAPSTTKDNDGAAVRRETFDRVVVAVGTFQTPKVPKLPGVEEFAGTMVHTIHFNRIQKEFEGKRVLCVGLHASTQDVAVALKKHGAAQLYASHRNGMVIVPKFGEDGAVFDLMQNLAFTLVNIFFATWIPNIFNWLVDTMLGRISKKAFPGPWPGTLGRLPAPSFATTAPLVTDENGIYPLMESGFCEPVLAVSKITGPKAVELIDGRVLEDIDAIVYCTGYDVGVPFIEKEYDPYPVPGAPSTLYRGLFSTHRDPEIRDSLAFLGHGFTPFPGFVQHELFAMAVSQIWQGNSRLPPLDEMKKWQRNWLAWREDLLRRQKSEATFYVGALPVNDVLPWLDETAGTDVFSHFAFFSRKAWSFWWSDRAFYHTCRNGVLTPTIWRLFETGKRKAWAGARQQIYLDNEAVKRGTEKRLAVMKAAENKKTR